MSFPLHHPAANAASAQGQPALLRARQTDPGGRTPAPRGRRVLVCGRRFGLCISTLLGIMITVKGLGLSPSAPEHVRQPPRLRALGSAAGPYAPSAEPVWKCPPWPRLSFASLLSHNTSFNCGC